MNISIWTIWFIIAILTAIIEILTPTFGFIFISGASLVALLASILHLHWFIQILLFCITVLVSLILIRPRLNKRFGSTGIPSKVERFIGQKGLITEAVDPVKGIGRVLINGEDWAARSVEAISLGTEVIIEGADGITLLVMPIEEGEQHV